MLVVSWGSTYGACLTAVRLMRREGHSVSHLHLRWLNPTPRDIGEILGRFKTVLVPEMNNGQLYQVLRTRYTFNGRRYNRIGGVPLRVEDLCDEIVSALSN